ncbi:MAG: thiamine diphosphokinase [Oscillospiraceae bacterium]|nr:thiamine diphosphokinase [Oscillospiraceae bacterium]
MLDRVCFIIGAGEVAPDLRLDLQEGDLLIAADAGWQTAERMGLTPHLVIGDFDTLPAPADHPNTIVLPCEKDVTDMRAAVDLGLERGFHRFALYGGTGGRLAHTLANLQLLDYLSQKNCRGFLIGDGTVSTAVTDGALDFPAELNGYLSVFCNSGTARGITLSGLKYTLTDGTLTGSEALGVSNEFTGQPAHVSVADGTLLVLWRGDNADESLLRRL